MASILSAEMLRGLDLKTFPAGTKIFSKGDKAEKAYLVVKGDVALITTTADGKNVPQGRLGVGHIFGEMALIEDGVRPHHAVAVTETSCAVIDETQMTARLGRVDPFMRYWVDFMSQRLLELSHRGDGVKPGAAP